ncbi:hypothetical protein [Paenibacillus sp. Soil522]|uniref:hypothetical protein n=1 Tax=Paenibacillus sp. Soil522 TaxID=1736388 RepID=UPI0012DEBBB2|nr:hypothetical protein [Paenibacillus sp. Soil522]
MLYYSALVLFYPRGNLQDAASWHWADESGMNIDIVSAVITKEKVHSVYWNGQILLV